jgi:hypothetical protein
MGAFVLPVASRQRDEQKLWLILFQLKAIRTRINSLALQYFAFSALAIVIVGAAMVLAAALALRPLGFLSTAIILAIATFIGVIRIIRTALRSSASPIKAASLADQRGGLKGRLMTVLLMCHSEQPSELWPYLVEDTYGRRSEFEPAKIEPRWFSRSIFALLAACLIGLVLVRFARLGIGSQPLHMSGLPSRVTADVGNLDIRPADPAFEPNAEIYADEATIQKLADKLAQTNGTDKGGLSQWINKARNLASDLQNEIRGHQQRPPVELRLTDKDDAGQSPHSRHGNTAPGGNNRSTNPGTGKSSSGSESAPKPGQTAGPLAQSGPGLTGQPGNDTMPAIPSDLGSAASGGSGTGGGVSHGAGSDPEHLFGLPSSQPLGSDSFKITIDAQPSDESSNTGAPAYIPPKVRAPLNERQYDDEPIARASVPPADQMTVKRVFAR